MPITRMGNESIKFKYLCIYFQNKINIFQNTVFTTKRIIFCTKTNYNIKKKMKTIKDQQIQNIQSHGQYLYLGEFTKYGFDEALQNSLCGKI